MYKKDLKASMTIEAVSVIGIVLIVLYSLIMFLFNIHDDTILKANSYNLEGYNTDTVNVKKDNKIDEYILDRINEGIILDKSRINSIKNLGKYRPKSEVIDKVDNILKMKVLSDFVE